MGVASPGGRFGLRASIEDVRAVLSTSWLSSSAVRRRFGLSEAQWARIRQRLPLEERRGDEGVREWRIRQRESMHEQKIGRTTVDDAMSYHAVDDRQREQMERIREKAKELAAAILDNTPPCADQSAAIRHVREALMTANTAIALKGAI